jgi:WS/DGAT/MGAT family acyltransferase
MRRLGGIDTMFVRAETPAMHLHVTGVLVLDPATMRAGGDPRRRIRDLVEARLPLLAPFRWRLVEAPGGLGTPRWIEDPDVDLDRHVHLATLPAPGGRAELARFVGDVAGTPLPRDRPLWEMHLVDGLADGTVAVVTKLHHAFMDGGAGAEVMASLFDLSAEGDAPPPPDLRTPDEVPSRWRLLGLAPGDALARLGAVPGALRQTATGVGGLLGAMFPDRGPAEADGDGAGGGAARARTAPRTPFNGPLTPERSVALADCPLPVVKRIGAAFDAKVNDVVLAAVAGALRAELAAQGALEALGDHPLVAAVPVSVRPDDLEGAFGNQTSAMMVPLPAQVADPVERLRAVHHLAARTKEQHGAMGSNLLEAWAGLVPPWAITTGSRAATALGLAHRLPPLLNLIVSNVAGPPIPLHLAGAEVAAIYPLGPLLEGSGLNVTVLSQCDTLHIGVIACPSLVPDVQAVADGIAAAVAELAAAVPGPRPRRRATPRSR